MTEVRMRVDPGAGRSHDWARDGSRYRRLATVGRWRVSLVESATWHTLGSWHVGVRVSLYGGRRPAIEVQVALVRWAVEAWKDPA